MPTSPAPPTPADGRPSPYHLLRKPPGAGDPASPPPAPTTGSEGGASAPRRGFAGRTTAPPGIAPRDPPPERTRPRPPARGRPVRDGAVLAAFILSMILVTWGAASINAALIVAGDLLLAGVLLATEGEGSTRGGTRRERTRLADRLAAS